jgi:hypothetical protein
MPDDLERSGSHLDQRHALGEAMCLILNRKAAPLSSSHCGARHCRGDMRRPEGGLLSERSVLSQSRNCTDATLPLTVLTRAVALSSRW